ncbi:Uma2 family endonuclease [Actinomycetes bacterium KLBMP 9759]
MAMPVPDGLLTLEDWEALPEDNSAHIELQWGKLVMSPKPTESHQDAVGELYLQIRKQLPPAYKVLFDFEVVVRAEAPAIVRAPDLVIIHRGRGRTRVPARDVIVAVEIISPGSRNVDTHLKAFEYAEAGIPWYWLIDLDPPAPTITVFGLGASDDGYRESQTATGELVVTHPFPLRVDIEALVAPRS